MNGNVKKAFFEFLSLTETQLFDTVGKSLTKTFKLLL